MGWSASPWKARHSSSSQVRSASSRRGRKRASSVKSFAARAKALDYSLIVSLSFELFDAHCWNDWKQRAWNGDPAKTGADTRSSPTFRSSRASTLQRWNL